MTWSISSCEKLNHSSIDFILVYFTDSTLNQHSKTHALKIVWYSLPYFVYTCRGSWAFIYQSFATIRSTYRITSIVNTNYFSVPILNRYKCFSTTFEIVVMAILVGLIVGSLKSIYEMKCALLDKIVNFGTQIVEILLYRNFDGSKLVRPIFGRHLGF